MFADGAATHASTKVLGSVGFLDRLTITTSRFAQAVAVEDRDAFDERFSQTLSPRVVTAGKQAPHRNDTRSGL